MRYITQTVCSGLRRESDERVVAPSRHVSHWDYVERNWRAFGDRRRRVDLVCWPGAAVFACAGALGTGGAAESIRLYFCALLAFGGCDWARRSSVRFALFAIARDREDGAGGGFVVQQILGLPGDSSRVWRIYDLSNAPLHAYALVCTSDVDDIRCGSGLVDVAGMART